MRDLDQMTNDDLVGLALRCPNIESVDLTHCIKVTGSGFTKFAKALSGTLRRFVLLNDRNAKHDRLTPTYLKTLVKFFGASLEELSISIPACITDLSPLAELSECESMHLYFRGMRGYYLPVLPKLKFLTVRTYSITYFKWSSAILGHSPWIMPNLTSLCIIDDLMNDSGLPKITMEQLHALVHRFPLLNALTIKTPCGNGVTKENVLKLAVNIGISTDRLTLW